MHACTHGLKSKGYIAITNFIHCESYSNFMQTVIIRVNGIIAQSKAKSEPRQELSFQNRSLCTTALHCSGAFLEQLHLLRSCVCEYLLRSYTEPYYMIRSELS